ncbi:tyrosine-type recombinase/integrase [Streptomyces sp. NPDC001389]|uniref:tyrosine-type recombinase/integrase n=1 Tax=Streptomyces sp. NPDC001389 TaxID=3364569 RepID=UPI00369D7826
MPGYIEDRWYTKRPDPQTGEKRQTARHGSGKRYRVAGIPGVKDRSFDRLTGPQGANAWLAKAQHQAASGEFVDPRRGAMLLERYITDEWWPGQTYEDPGTRRTVKGRVWNHIIPHLGSVPLNAVKTPQLRTWLATLKTGLGPGTVSEAWGYLSAILQSAVDDERITKNYCRAQTTVRPPGRPEVRPRAWDKDTVLAVQKALPERFMAMVDLGVGAGLRQGEVFGLAVEDIDTAAGVIHVRRQVKKIGSRLVFALPKNRKTRVVPIPPYLVRAVQDHSTRFPPRPVTLPWGDPDPGETEKEIKARAPQTFTLIFTGPMGGAVRRDSWDTRAWKPALAAAGLIPAPARSRKPIKSRPNVQRTYLKYEESREHGFHALRHTFTSVQLDAREPIVAVSKWLGHKDASITLKIYAHMMPEADGRGRSAMEAWFAGT